MAYDHFYIKAMIHFNKGSMEVLKSLTGKRALVVADSVMDRLGYLQTAQDYLREAGIASNVFTEVRPDPDIHVVAAGVKAYDACGPDVLVALGGGSSIDTAKAILYFVRQRCCEEGIEFNRPLFIAIPSTSGTGSEVTDFSVITAEDTKHVLIDKFIAPDVAVLDSTCIQHVPQAVIADTGMDVLVHALEAYASKSATDFTDALAEKAVDLIFEHLKRHYDDPADDEARNHVQNASCMAGMAFTNAGLGIVHSLAHALGAEFHLAHGRCNSLLLEHVLAYNADLAGAANNHAARKYQKIAERLRLPARTPREGTFSLVRAAQQLKKKLDIQHRIGEIDGIDRESFERALEDMAEKALKDRCTATNPVRPTKEELVILYRKAY